MDGDVIYQCEGCDYNNAGTCRIYFSPENKFRIGKCKTCGNATHIKTLKNVEKVRLGQQKQKKKK
jgi:hypothetical protein